MKLFLPVETQSKVEYENVNPNYSCEMWFLKWQFFPPVNKIMRHPGIRALEVLVEVFHTEKEMISSISGSQQTRGDILPT